MSGFHDLHLERHVLALFVHGRLALRKNNRVTVLRDEIEGLPEQLASNSWPRLWLLTGTVSLADCVPLVISPPASMVLQTFGQPIALPPVLQFSG